MQRAAGAAMWASSSYRAIVVAVAVCWMAPPGARSAPVTTSVPMAELFTLEDPLSSSAPFEFPDEYSISIEQAMIDRNDFAKAAVLRMIFAMAEDIAHERQVSAALLEAVDGMQKRLRRHEDKARALEQRAAAATSGTPAKLKEREPASCQDLRSAGHVLSGFYLVKVADRMETVFCSFTDDKATAVSHANTSQTA